MNKLDLSAYGVSELTKEEMVTIDGGGKLKDFFIAVGEFIVDTVRDALCKLLCPCPR
jgi:hypothetical protein